MRVARIVCWMTLIVNPELLLDLVIPWRLFADRKTKEFALNDYLISSHVVISPVTQCHQLIQNRTMVARPSARSNLKGRITVASAKPRRSTGAIGMKITK